MAFNNGNYNQLIDGASNNNNSTDGTNADGTNNQAEEEPIENQWNDLTGMFDVKDEPMRMNDDTPSVEIYISREKVWQTDDDGKLEFEEGVEMASLAKELEEAYANDPEANEKNTSTTTVNGQTVLANNAIGNIYIPNTNSTNSTNTTNTTNSTNTHNTANSINSTISSNSTNNTNSTI